MKVNPCGAKSNCIDQSHPQMTLLARINSNIYAQASLGRICVGVVDPYIVCRSMVLKGHQG